VVSKLSYNSPSAPFQFPSTESPPLLPLSYNFIFVSLCPSLRVYSYQSNSIVDGNLNVPECNIFRTMYILSLKGLWAGRPESHNFATASRSTLEST